MGTVVVASGPTNMSKDEILLEGEFEVFPKERLMYQVELTRTGITYYPTDSEKSKKTVKYIHFGDVIGCRCRKSLDQKHATKAYLTIFTYPLKKKYFSEKWVRNKNPITFARSTDNSFDGNRKVVERWRRVILHLCQQLPVNKKARDEGCTLDAVVPTFDLDVEKCPVPPKTKLLVLVNPHSGPGKAMQIYERQVAPMLDEADIHVKLIQTEYAGHGREIMKSINRSDYYGVVIISGDGLIYEVINGLMAREDWKDAMLMPVGCLPGGSGNALSCSINYSAGESIETDMVLHSTFILIKHRVISMDLVLIEQPRVHLFSFLSVTWGLLADIDYESEKYRAIGEARFTLQAIRRILALRKYKARLSFLPLTEYIPKSSNNNTTKDVHIPGHNATRGGSFNSFEGMDIGTDVDTGMHSKSVPARLCNGKSESDLSTENDTDEKLMDIRESFASGDFSPPTPMTMTGPGSSPQRDAEVKFTLSTDDIVSEAQRRKERLSSSSGDGDGVQNGEMPDVTRRSSAKNGVGSRGNGTVPSLLPPLDESVPADWVTLDEEFVTVCATYQTHLGSDLIMAPHAHFNDRIIHLWFVKAGIQKAELFGLMGMLEKGTHVDHPSPNVELIKCLAFRLEPESKDGVIMVDGEKVDCEPLQGQVLPGLAKLMAIQ